jgi:membrane associated rhomboid family serine protease
MRNITDTVKHLLIINVIFFIATIALGEIVFDLFALHYPSNPKFQFWQPLTHMFMHGDLGHIFFNMFALYMFGIPIEQMWGRNKFIFFYLSTGFGAAALQLGLYYFQVNEVSELLIAQGQTGSQIATFFETRDLSYSLIELIGREKLLTGLSAYNAVMVGASGALVRSISSFCFFISECALNVVVSSHSNQSQSTCASSNFGRLIFWFYFLFHRSNCSFCPCRRSHYGPDYDVVLEEKSI